MNENLTQRLDALKASRTIAGWRDFGGPNFGLSGEVLPAMIYPINLRHGKTYYDEESLERDVTLLELESQLV